MAVETSRNPAGIKANRSHLVAPLAMIMVLFVMLVPLPTIALDFFITLNVTLSIIILLVSMYIDKPVSFSVFPSLLLVITLFRLALNLASTRLILLNGGEGTGAAGQVIRAFGEFVVGGSYVVGAVVFIVLIVIQYVVVNHGAVRISEVTARFTLDAMPGKQMAIDADLSAGTIDEEEARRRRKEISQEAEFYGAMDGAIRFTQRDALASILITCINIIAGFIIGVVQLGMSMEEALRTYTILTIGDGLVSAMPSLLIAVAGGIITTRFAGRHTLGEEMTDQIAFNTRPLFLGAALMTALALVPGMPKLSFFVLAAICFGLGRAASARDRQVLVRAAEAEKLKEVKPVEEQVESFLKVDLLALEIGYGLIPVVDRSQGGDLVDRIKNIRRQIALEMGVIVPPIHISDNLKLQPREYAVLLKDSAVERGEIHPQMLMAINPGGVDGKLDGIATVEPSYLLPAFWIKPEIRENAQMRGFTVVDAATVMVTHLAEVIRRHAAELMTRQETQALLERVAREHPKVVEELVPNLLTVGDVQKVLQNLLKERVPIRDTMTILETLADFARSTRNTAELTEYVRQALKRIICSRLADDRKELRVFTMSGDMERLFQESIRNIREVPVFVPDPESARSILEKFHDMFGQSPEMMRSVVLCSSGIRSYVRNFLEQYFPYLNVLSYSEIPSSLKVVSMGMVN